MPRSRLQLESAVGRWLASFSWRRWSAVALVVCCALLAGGPSLAILFPLNVSETSSTEEETTRTDSEEFCTRTAVRRMPPRLVIEHAAMGYPLITRGPVAAPTQFESRSLADVDLDARLGAGAPLRC